MNYEAAQLVVGAALISPRYRDLLLRHRQVALNSAERQPGAPEGLRVAEDDRKALRTIQAETLEEFARGVERMRRLRYGRGHRTAPAAVQAREGEAAVSALAG